MLDIKTLESIPIFIEIYIFIQYLYTQIPIIIYRYLLLLIDEVIDDRNDV